MKKLKKQPFKPGDIVVSGDDGLEYTVTDCVAGDFGSGWGVACTPDPWGWAGAGQQYSDAAWFTLKTPVSK